MSEDRLDIIIMGATGFSGRHTAKVLSDLAKQDSITWGIAGRNLTKLQKLSKDLIKEDQNLPNIPVFVADVYDEESLVKMTVRTKVLINCCGPYRFYGESVVKACVQTQTHYLDVSGEPQVPFIKFFNDLMKKLNLDIYEFMEEMQLRYHKSAAEQGVYVVSACGMSGILADLGVFHFVKLFEGTVNDVEFYVNFELTGKIGSPIHDGTWASLIHGLAHKNELRDLRKKLFPEPLPKLQPKIKKRSVLHKNKLLSGWCLPFPGADRSVVRRSQYLMYTERNKRPIQSEAYFLTSSLFLSVFCMIFFATIAVVGIIGGKFSRKLLLKVECVIVNLPKPGDELMYKENLNNEKIKKKCRIQSYVSHEGPSEIEANNVILSLTYFGNGWNNKITKNEFCQTPDKSMKMKLSAKNPGYGFTCYSIILAALTILNERKSMPGKGGVYPPGYAFSGTSLIHKLQNWAGLKIEIL